MTFAGKLKSSRDLNPFLDQQTRDLLSIIDNHFRDRKFLLGDRPSAADFALYGCLGAHLYSDRHVVHFLEGAVPVVCDWIQTMMEMGEFRGEIGQKEFGDWIHLDDNIPETLKQLLQYISKTYIPVSSTTAVAAGKREKQFTVEVYGLEVETAT